MARPRDKPHAPATDTATARPADTFDSAGEAGGSDGGLRGGGGALGGSEGGGGGGFGSGGEGGGDGAIRIPQSSQSVPVWQTSHSLPSPPSSQLPSEPHRASGVIPVARSRQLLEHTSGDGGFGGTGGDGLGYRSDIWPPRGRPAADAVRGRSRNATPPRSIPL